MPSAKGSLSSRDGSRFVATFLIEEALLTYSGHLNPNTGPFNVPEATLTYDKEDDLTGVRSFVGQVGISDVTLNIQNGPVISGPLSQEVRPAILVNGSGSWPIP